MKNKLLYIPDEAIGKPVEKPNKDKEWEHFTPEFVGTQVQTLDLEVLEKQVALSQKLYKLARLGQRNGRVTIQTERPIMIVFLGDVHYGSVFTDHNRFNNDLEIIEETPGVYVIFMSNLIDNAIPSQFPSNMLVNVMPPDKQTTAMRKKVERLNKKRKVLGAVTSPCHEGWTWKHTGQDVNVLIYGFPDRRFPVMDNGSILTVKMAKTLYRLGLFHQVGPFESNFNETHALRQMNRLNLQMKGDVVVGAHKHYATAQLVYEGDGSDVRPVAYLRTGTYKGIGDIPDQWAMGRYGTSGEPSGQSIILWGDKRKISVNLELDVAIKMYSSL